MEHISMARFLVVVLYGLAAIFIIDFTLDLRTALDTWDGNKSFLAMLRPGFNSLAYAAVLSALAEQPRLSIRIGRTRASAG